jgi:CDP-diacylglycerol--serine O-phosphatidyltransferase
MLWLLPAFIIACAAAYRLAKFNLATDQQYSFKGVPVPAIGLLIASFPLILHFNEISGVNSFLLNKWFLYILILVVSYLMVSNIRMISLKFPDFTFKNNLPKIILLVIAIIAVLFLHWLAVPLIFTVYILLSFTQKKIKAE